MSDTAPGHGQSDTTPAPASRTAAASAGPAAPGSGCGGAPGVGTSASRPAGHTGSTLPPSACTPHGTARG
ncbi:hypothetical protein [Streptomyces prasinopilosus]|uniref:hypothetical protein n=1 Tax=Streptomyces prasinopilosus TaxID=67344 RepID=UPI0012FED6AC|nr:hypothetical protein [Streptomyces prasinopilosus]